MGQVWLWPYDKSEDHGDIDGLIVTRLYWRSWRHFHDYEDLDDDNDAPEGLDEDHEAPEGLNNVHKAPKGLDDGLNDDPQWSRWP